MTKEELLQYRAKRKELRQIEERIQDVRANARSAKAVRYDSVYRQKETVSQSQLFRAI